MSSVGISVAGAGVVDSCSAGSGEGRIEKGKFFRRTIDQDDASFVRVLDP